jgi:aminopeptidase N
MFFNKVPSNSMTITKFPKTKLMPSYIMCFAAGNYYEVPSNLPGVPMSLYCPLSVIDTVNNYSKFIFDISSKCMKLYEAKFKTPYPFSKYDQIFIREGHFVGMENPGLVTLDESYCLPKENPTKYDYYYLALLVAH